MSANTATNGKIVHAGNSGTEGDGLRVVEELRVGVGGGDCEGEAVTEGDGGKEEEGAAERDGVAELAP
jgi:hypothetical protein